MERNITWDDIVFQTKVQKEIAVLCTTSIEEQRGRTIRVSSDSPSFDFRDKDLAEPPLKKFATTEAVLLLADMTIAI
jgi:hypothetical protein